MTSQERLLKNFDKAIAYYQQPGTWAMGTLKRNRPNGPTAYCASGMCQRFPSTDNAMLDYLERVVQERGNWSVSNYNDFTLSNRQGVIGLFRAAKRLAEQDMQAINRF